MIARLDDPRDPRFEPLLALYARAIPARERKPDAAIRAMAASPQQIVLVAIDDDALIGFALVYTGPGLALLEYMAVDETRRGSGLGAALYRAARAAAGDRPFLVEVESDREDTPDRALRTRRIGFYHRLGARRLEGLDYVLPLPGDGPPPLIDLLVDGWPADAVPADVVADWLREIYANVYACPPDDPRLAAMNVTLAPRLTLS